MVDPSHAFHVADYVVFSVTIFISIGIGIYYARAGDRQRTTTEYLVGGRAMKFMPVAISLMVSFESSIMMLGLPAEMYVYGVQWWISCLGYLVSQLLSVTIMVPLLHPLKITSAYEYLQLRFNSTAVRLLGSVLGMMTYTWYMGIVLFGPAIALEAVTGFPQWSSIFVIAFVAVIYTSIGGLKAVIWTDVFQAFVMYAGMFAILIKGTIDVGGATKVWNIAKDNGRLNFLNFDPDPRTRHTVWNLFFGNIIRGFGLAFNQSTVQRVSATKTQREAKMVLLIMAPCFFLSLTMACYEGIVAFAYYQNLGCDPLASKKIFNPNQIIPFTVMDIFSNLPGMPGLFLASLFSASLSTLSSGLSSLSALMWADFIKPRIGQVSEVKATLIAKFCVVLFGLCGCGVALLVSLIGGTLIQISGSLLAAFAGPLTGLFLMGCFCPWANAKGAFIGGLLSLIFSSWLSLGKSFSKSVKKAPWLPLASTEKCLANHSASLFNSTTSGYYYGGSTLEVMLNESHYDYGGGGYGFHYDSTAMSSVLEMTTAQPPVADTGPHGIEAMYTLSYQWLAPVGIFITIALGSIISILTGGNKEGEVHPRYLISFCDHMCFFLPASVRAYFRCADDYTAVKDENLSPARELFLDMDVTISDPSRVPPPPPPPPSEKQDHSATLHLHPEALPPGSDVKLLPTNQDASERKEPQNGSISVNYSALTSLEDEKDGDVGAESGEKKGEGGGGEEKEGEEEEKEGEMDDDSPTAKILQNGSKE